MVTTVKYEDQGSNVIVNNAPVRKVIRTYDAAQPKIEVQETVSPETVSNIEVSEEAPTRVERAAQFKHASSVERRAQQMKKDAEAQLAQAKNFQQVMEQAKKDPTVIAKALGMDPQEFYRQYQNVMLNVKEEPAPLKPEEEMKARLDKYEQERAQERQQLETMQSQTIRNNYISTKILPVITANTEKFELLNMNGKDACAGFIYDLMDSHYRQTGQELDANEVAEEMERQLTDEIETKIQAVRKVSKFSKHFQAIQEETQQTTSQAQKQLGSISKRNEIKPKTLSNTMSSSLGESTADRSRMSELSREDRIKRIMAKQKY